MIWKLGRPEDYEFGVGVTALTLAMQLHIWSWLISAHLRLQKKLLVLACKYNVVYSDCHPEVVFQ